MKEFLRPKGRKIIIFISLFILIFLFGRFVGSEFQKCYNFSNVALNEGASVLSNSLYNNESYNKDCLNNIPFYIKLLNYIFTILTFSLTLIILSNKNQLVSVLSALLNVFFIYVLSCLICYLIDKMKTKSLNTK